MGVAGVPPALIHVDPTLETQLKLLLPGCDLDLGTERLVFVTAGRINDHLAPRKPALCRAIDVGVTDLTKPGVATDIDVPRIEIGVDLVVMAMRLIRHTVGRSEVDAARDDLPGLVVDHAHLHPVLARFRQRNVNLFGVDRPFVLNLSPLDAVDRLTFARNFNRCRWHARQLNVGRTRLGVLRFAETFVVIIQEIFGGLLWKRMSIGAFTAVDCHVKVERFFRLLGIFEVDSNRTTSGAREWVLINVSKGHASDDEAMTMRNELDRLDDPVRRRVAPRPQPVPLRLRLHHFGLTPARLVETSLVARYQLVALVGHRNVRVPYAVTRYPLAVANGTDLVPFANWNRHRFGVFKSDHVVRHMNPNRPIRSLLRFQLPVSENHVVCSLADRQRYRRVAFCQRDITISC